MFVLGIQCLHSLIWSLGTNCLIESNGIDFLPFVFIIMLIYSVIGGWNIDLADSSYQVNNIISNKFVKL